MSWQLQALGMDVDAGWRGCLSALVRHAKAAVQDRWCTSIRLRLLTVIVSVPGRSSRCSYRSACVLEARIAVMLRCCLEVWLAGCGNGRCSSYWTAWEEVDSAGCWD
jgi:hypothetical protein